MTRRIRTYPLLSPLDKAKLTHDQRMQYERHAVLVAIEDVKRQGERQLGPNVIDLVALRVALRVAS